jgi:hypothetical protein
VAEIEIITHEILLSSLHYDPETGFLTWLSGAIRSDRVGKMVGSNGAGGYIRLIIKGRGYQAHRLAWFYMTGRWPKEQIDHINLDKTDNRFVNLREATQSQNQTHRRRLRNNKTGYTGVSVCGKNGRFIATYSRNNRNICIGSFDRPEEAYAAYLAAIAYRGEFIAPDHRLPDSVAAAAICGPIAPPNAM